MRDAAPRSISFVVYGPIRRDDLPGLCARVCLLLEQQACDVAYCTVQGVAADAVTVDALTRLQLAARAHRCRVRLRNAPEELLELVGFMGLSDVVGD